ncbi:tail fiber domain-containing protein [Escherichia coli]|nr:tail fiber domain-containing protein [Escherichia coli]MCK3282461.1 tail fiber domain-containing protein [Escherichia coli]
MIYTTGTIAINGNTVTGTGTDFSAPLSLIRVGCTLIAVSDPIQIFTITEIKSGTELSVTPAANPAIPAGTKFSILLSDSISVDGLAQDVAETLRYYQSKETEVAEALEWSQNHIADKIGLGAEHRNWPDCNDPTGYIGFCRAVEAESHNFPSIASGEVYLVGWLARGDNAVINGCFVGTISLSLYTYRYNPSDNTQVWAKQAKQGDSPTFENVILERTLDQEATAGGLVRSVLKGSDGAHRVSGQFYSEIRGDNKSYTTISNHRGDKNAYAAVTEDGDFVLSSGDFIGRSFRFHDGGKCANTSYNNQWTVLQDFTIAGINSADFSRRLKLLVAGSTTANADLLLWGSELRPSVFEYKLSNPDTEEGICFGFYCQLNTDNSVSFHVNGSINCTTLNQSSDRDLKDNIQVIGDATEAIRKMNGYTYTLKENGLPYAGVIAQEVMEALPEAVGSFTHYGKSLQGPTVDGNELREETRYLNVDYAAVTGLLVQVARETDNRVTELEEENASLRANIAEMDERIAKLEELVSKLTGSEK